MLDETPIPNDKNSNIVDEAGLATRLRRTVESLCAIGPRSTADADAVRQSIDLMIRNLKAVGYTVGEHRFGDGAGDVNLVCEAPGQARPDMVMEVAAHYDTVPECCGADDNASGVAAVLELANRLAIDPLAITVRFCLFGREESGMHGSKAHVEALARREERHRGALIFESIGYCGQKGDEQKSPLRVPGLLRLPRAADFIAAVANLPSRRLCTAFAEAAARVAPGLPVHQIPWQGSVLPQAARSDNRAYWRKGYRALMITDTANFRNPNYHRSSDLPDTIDFEFMADVVRASYAMVRTLAPIHAGSGPKMRWN